LTSNEPESFIRNDLADQDSNCGLISFAPDEKLQVYAQALLAVTPLKLFRGQVSLGESQGYCATEKAELRQALSKSVVGELPFSR